jgi:CRISPR-associated Csx2 family protein
MANILISSLGTGQKRDGGYKKAKYSYKDQEIETTFISNALSQMLKIDRLFLVGTKGSIWDSAYKEFSTKERYSEEIELELLEKTDEKRITEKELEIINQTIDAKLGQKGSKCFLIDYGIDDKELWNNFEKYMNILNHIKDDDVVYIDITHAFRSLSLMSFLMVQFGHIVKDKKFKIGGIFYGMLEVSHENNGITPIVDLKIFYDLMEWIKAIDNFKNYANGDNITHLLENSDSLRNEYNIFSGYTNSMRIANMASVKRNINTISKKLNSLEQSQNPIIRLMTEEMKSFVKRLDKEKMSDFQLALSHWYCEHKHYALSYMALAEAIVSKSCEVHGEPIDTKNGRDKAKGKIHRVDKELGKTYKSINKIRNNICHQLQKREDAITADIKNLSNYIDKCKLVFEQNKE